MSTYDLVIAENNSKKEEFFFPEFDRWNAVAENRTYKNIYSKIQNEVVTVRFFYGKRGGGKTHLVQKLAEQFPKNSIKIDISCKDATTCVKEKLKQLAFEFKKDKGIDYTQCIEIQYELDNNSAEKLVNALRIINKNILIIIENFDESEKSLIKSLFTSLEKLIPLNLRFKIHVYITSRENIIFEGLSQSQEKVIIQGFNQEEAVEFLFSKGPEGSTKEDAEEILNHFEKLPLVLVAVKAFCITCKVGYKECFEKLQSSYPPERESWSYYEDYGKMFPELFNAITIPFLPEAKSDFNLTLYWKVMCCVSYLDHNMMPESVITQFSEYLCDRKDSNKDSSKNLIQELVKWKLCKKAKINDKDFLNFYPVVLDAFRFKAQALRKQNLDPLENFDPLKQTFVMMCGMVSKDMRKPKHSDKMFRLRPHVENLLKHVEETKMLQSERDPSLMKVQASHLHETLAAIMLAESPILQQKSEDHFGRALINLSDQKFVDFINNKKKMKDHDLEEELAEIVVKKSEELGSSLPKTFITDFTSSLNISSVKEDISFSNSDNKKDEKRRKLSLSKSHSKTNLMNNFKKSKFVLSPEKHSKIFYAERIAQIVHSWSRVVLQADKKKLERDGTWYKRLSSLSTCISKQCREKLEVSLLCEWLSSKKVRISILLKQKSSAMYYEALQTCKEALSTTRENTYMYEDGFLKNAFEPSYQLSRIYFLRAMVRIYARMVKSRSEDEAFLKEGDNVCNELFNWSTETEKVNVMSLIYCAKYYASRQHFNKSMECFDWYFKSLEDDPDRKPNFNTQCWAVHNYSRAVACFPPYSKAGDALKKCKDLLQVHDDFMRGDLNSLLNEHVEKLEEIYSVVESLKELH